MTSRAKAQPNASALINYRLDNCSSEKLMEFFSSLGCEVDVLILPAVDERRGAMHVLVAV